MKMRNLFMTAVLASSVILATPVLAATAFTLTSTSDFRNSSWSFGEIFTVGSSNITVNSLGAYDAGGDGFVTAGGIPVGIFRESDGALLASTNVTGSDPLIANFRYQAISSLVLVANTSYRVVAVNRDDLYNIATAFTVDPAITRTGYGYCNTTSLTSCNNIGGSERVWMANFQFNGGVPEPATWALMIVGFGLVGVSMRRPKAAMAA